MTTDLYEFVKTRSRELGQEFTGADDDWQQFAFLETKDGALGILPLNEHMDDKELLDKVILPAAVKESEAVRVVLLLNAYKVTVEGTRRREDAEGIVPSQHPEREECLLIREMTKDGLQRTAQATILRDGEQPPALTPWEDWPTEQEGRFTETVIEALQEVSA